MRSLLTLVLVSGCLCAVAWCSSVLEDQLKESIPASSSSDPHHISSSSSSRNHNRAIRQSGADGLSLMALGVFGAFVKYLVYYFITENAKERRSLEENLLDLTRITTCLKEEEVFLPNFHLHCFFPSYFNREDNDIISELIWGNSKEGSTVRSPFLPNKSLKHPELNQRQFHEILQPEG